MPAPRVHRRRLLAGLVGRSCLGSARRSCFGRSRLVLLLLLAAAFFSASRRRLFGRVAPPIGPCWSFCWSCCWSCCWSFCWRCSGCWGLCWRCCGYCHWRGGWGLYWHCGPWRPWRHWRHWRHWRGWLLLLGPSLPRPRLPRGLLLLPVMRPLPLGPVCPWLRVPLLRWLRVPLLRWLRVPRLLLWSPTAAAAAVVPPSFLCRLLGVPPGTVALSLPPRGGQSLLHRARSKPTPRERSKPTPRCPQTQRETIKSIIRFPSFYI